MSLTLGTDGKIYMFGGRAAGVASNVTWEFDPPAASWREITIKGAQPAPRFGHNAWFDVARNRFVIALGQGDGSAFFDDVWSFSPASEIWTQLGASSAERPEKRYGAAGAYDPSGDRLVISHGFTSLGRFDDTWFFDIAGGSWSRLQTSAAVPLKRCLTRGAWSAERKEFLLFGGQSNEVPYLGDFWALDTAAGIWTEKKPAVLPGPRNLYGAAFDIRAGRWFIAGGQTADGPSDEAWMYELATDAWSQIPAQSPPAARHSLDIAGTRSKFYMFGGSTGQGETDEMWQLELGSR